LVGFYKVNSGKPSMTWSQSVDQALCFGWIDGIRRSVDKDSYCIRFTPRRPASIWSAINVDKVEKLTKQGLMKPAGLDSFKLKKDYKSLGVRAVPHAVARYGAYLAKNVVLMPSYVNIGAYVDEGTMVDTWATVGSCAQIGKGVHLSGGVGIGGVLEPLQASPVIVEDGCSIFRERFRTDFSIRYT